MAPSKAFWVVSALASVVSAPATTSSKTQFRASPRSPVAVAQHYVIDSLIDPTSALFRHVAATKTSPTEVSVCGYVWAKNGKGFEVMKGNLRFGCPLRPSAVELAIWSREDRGYPVFFS